MTREQIDAYTEAMNNGTIPDAKNPLACAQTFHTDLLVKIAGHCFDMVTLARYELKSRGLNEEGMWVGFKDAERIFDAYLQKRSAPRMKTPKKGRRI